MEMGAVKGCGDLYSHSGAGGAGSERVLLGPI